jgi:hypothetical protein
VKKNLEGKKGKNKGNLDISPFRQYEETVLANIFQNGFSSTKEAGAGAIFRGAATVLNGA